MENKVIIAIDDLHPEQGWGCEGDESIEYLQELNKEFGCKFTLFIPSNYHKKYPLSKYKDWVKFWLNKDWVELAAHGHYHACDRNDIGECEFLELQTEQEVEARLEKCLFEWKEVNHKPLGWRNPGWVAHTSIVKPISKYFKYVALHEKHNHEMKWDCKMFFGCDGIHQIDSINLYRDTFMFQSHIAGNWNDNVWNKENYNKY